MFRKLIPVFILLISYSAEAQKKETSPRPMNWKDVSTWRYIPSQSVNFSADGKWAAYALVSVEGDGEIILKNLQTDSTKKYPVGGHMNPSMEFSEDGKYFVFKEYPKYRESKAASKTPGRQLFEKLHLVSLSDMKKIEFDKAGRYSFNGKEQSYLAIALAQVRTPGAAPVAGGNDLLLYELSTGKKLSLGKIGEYAFNKKGNTLAYTISGSNSAENGLFTMNLADKRISVIDNDTISYKSLNWTEDKDALAVLKLTKDKKFKTDKGSILAVKNVTGKPEIFTYDPIKDSVHFPKEMTISGNRAPTWSEDLSTIFFGINTLEAVQKEMEEDAKKDTAKKNPLVDLEKLKADTSIKSIDDLKKALARLDKPAVRPAPNKKDIDKPDMVIWNWKDRRLQSNQQVTERMDKVFSFAAMYNIQSNTFHQISDSAIQSVRILPKDLFAFGIADTAYQLDRNLDGQNYSDLYIIDLKSGEKTLFKEKFYIPSGASMPNPSPDGKKFVYGNDGHYYVYDLVSKKERNLTANIPSSFINTENDLNVTKPLTGITGWSSDSKYILINDLWDIWQVNADGSGAVNLTQNGSTDKIKYQRRYNIYPDDKGIDFKKPQYFGIYGEWTKKSGIVRLDPSKKGLKPGPVQLAWDDAAYGSFNKTLHSDTYYFSKETFNTPTEFYVTNSKLTNPKQVTENAPDKKKYIFSAGTRLVNYVTDKGDSLQGVIYLPAGYEEGKKYPTIVYYYEKTSQGMHRYVTPSFPGGGYNPTLFTSNGYAVFTPDIVYKLDDPGMSAVWAVLPAVKAAIATGIVDADKMGLQGHSWGGYQTAFLATQTNMFKAAAPGAALTNMISMYSLIYWNSGGGNMSIFESSQGRFKGAPWENWDSYLRNSPIYHVKKVETPILMLHNDKDGAVDFTQGVEFYNALRRLKKPIVMIQYKGENHGIAKLENKKDYAVRMLEFFDHYLKGKPAPDWWEQGIDRLKMEEHLEERAF
ncbi:MAG: prolyl oligopeptidase family serine peptidase [Ginsengibacter sp.]